MTREYMLTRLTLFRCENYEINRVVDMSIFRMKNTIFNFISRVYSFLIGYVVEVYVPI